MSTSERQRAIVEFPEEMMVRVLKVPSNTHIAAVHYDPYRMMFVVVLQGDCFPSVPPETELPIVPTTRRFENDLIKIEFDYSRWKPEGEQ